MSNFLFVQSQSLKVMVALVAVAAFRLVSGVGVFGSLV